MGQSPAVPTARKTQPAAASRSATSTRRRDRIQSCSAATQVVPLFVLDTGILRSGSISANRATFLAGALADLDAHLREQGGHLVVRSGDIAKEVERVVTDLNVHEVHLAADVSGYSQRRERALRERLGCRLRVHAHSITVV